MTRIPALALTCLFTLAPVSWGAGRFEVFFDVPPGLEAYSGKQAVTFGVPFEKGALDRTDGIRLVDAGGRPLPAQFEITATHGLDSPQVRWLLIDCFADIRDGQAARAFIEFGKEIPLSQSGDPVLASREGRLVPPAGFTLDQSQRFRLTDGTGKSYTWSDAEPELEKNGPVRAVVKYRGSYRAVDGVSIADFTARVRFYQGSSFARVYHTLIWTTDEQTSLGGLHFTWSGNPDSATAGIAGKAVPLARDATHFQTSPEAGKRWDGWAAAPGKQSVFLGLRWAWQQSPVSVGLSRDGLTLGLIGPEQPLSLRAQDAAVDAVKRTGRMLDNGGYDFWDTNTNVPLKPGGKDGKEGWISPRGIAKTHEFLVWLGDESTPAAVKNILAQHPVIAHADPAFAVKASLPSPASPRDSRAFPEEEAALKRAFDWTTREDARDGDYGVWNFGDIQWHWVELGGYTGYRYWMNNGKGWSVVPWALWLRSGDRDYFEKGEANSRHVMDIDTCHVDDWSKEGKPRDGKIRGGIYHYSALHWAYGPRLLPFYVDSEYLPNCYFMTGYERARDVMEERIEGIKRSPETLDYLFTQFQDPQKHSRHLYAPAKDLLVLYEATWDPVLGEWAARIADLILKGQRADGQFFGVKTNHYLDQTLNIAHRVLDADRGKKISEAIARWTVFTGNNETGGPSINVENGWYSLWSQVAAAEHLGDRRFADRAARIFRTQAAVVDSSDTEWRGINPIFIHEIGPALRDWPIVMKAIAEGRADASQRFEPMTYICATLSPGPGDAAAGWKHREAGLVLKETVAAASVKIHLWGGGVGEMEYRLKVSGPQGSDPVAETRKVSFAGQYGAAQDASGPIAFDIPEGPAGVYAIEILMKDRAPSLHLQTSTGRIVYPVIQGKGNRFYSPTYSGQMWFRPEAAGKPVVIGFPANQVMGRITVLGPDGTAVAAEQARGTRQVQATDHGARPEGQPIRYTPASVDLHSVILPVPRDKNCSSYISGCQPWFAARKEQWFDPAAYPGPDLESLLK